MSSLLEQRSLLRKILVCLTVGVASSAASAANHSNCLELIDPSGGAYYAYDWLTRGYEYYCYGTYADTAQAGCQSAYDGLRSLSGLDLYGAVAVTLSQPPSRVGDWGVCSPMGQVLWLGEPCKVAPLTPLTDPDAVRFEQGDRWRPDRLTSDFQQKLQCFENGVTQAGGSYTPTSAWRPTPYQQHLWEILDRDTQLTPMYVKSFPQCKALRATIDTEMIAHGLQSGQKVGRPGLSRHESGRAFDVTPANVGSTQLGTIASQCGVQRNAVPGEPWHYQ